MSYLGDYCLSEQHEDCGDEECCCQCHESDPLNDPEG